MGARVWPRSGRRRPLDPLNDARHQIIGIVPTTFREVGRTQIGWPPLRKSSSR